MTGRNVSSHCPERASASAHARQIRACASQCPSITNMSLDASSQNNFDHTHETVAAENSDAHVQMNHLRLRTCDWTQRPKPLRRTKREIICTSDLYRRALVQRKHAHKFNCTGTAKTTDIEVSEQRASSYVTRRPSRNMSQLLINTGKGIERNQIESNGKPSRRSPLRDYFSANLVCILNETIYY